jgi:hypothetical protein
MPETEAANTPDGGELELEVDPLDEDIERAQDLAEEEARAEAKSRKRRSPRSRRSAPKPPRAAPPPPETDTSEAEVEEVLRGEPEIAKVYSQFAGKVASANDLAVLYAGAFAPLGLFVHETFLMHDETTGEPTGECKQLAKGTWPAVKKFAPGWLAWLKTHSPEVLAIATMTFFASRKAPIVMQLVDDPSQLRINRLRAAAAGAAAQHRPPEGAAAASQVVSIDQNKPKEAA